MFKFTIEAATLPEMRQKLQDLLDMHPPVVMAQYVAQDYPEVKEQAAPAKPKKAPKPKPVISVEDLQKLCTDMSAKVGMPAVKALIKSFGAGSIKELTDEQREELAAKMEHRHE